MFNRLSNFYNNVIPRTPEENEIRIKNIREARRRHKKSVELARMRERIQKTLSEIESLDYQKNNKANYLADLIQEQKTLETTR